MPTTIPDYTVSLEYVEDRGEIEVFNVAGPNGIREQLIPLHGAGAEALSKRFGEVPSRASLKRWRTSGYPVDRNGPRVRLPAVTRLKRVKTSHEALHRWFMMIQYLGDSIRESGSVERWRESYRASMGRDAASRHQPSP